MRAFFKLNNIPLKIVSVLIASLMWAYVVTGSSTEQSYSNLSFVPRISGTQELADRGLMVTGGLDTQYHFSLRGRRNEISKLKEMGARGITVTADLSDITTAGMYSIRPSIKTEYSASVVSASPNAITYTVENIVSKTVPIEITQTGEVDSGFRLGNMTTDIESVEITGAESYVAKVAAAQAAVDISGSEARVAKAELVLIDAQGEPVDPTFVQADHTSVAVQIGMNQVVSVPLGVVLIPSADILTNMVDVNIEPKEVRVYGDPNIIRGLTRLSLGSIDLAQVSGNPVTINNLSIKLPAGVSLLDGESAYPTITLTIDDTTDTTVNVRNIEMIDQNQNAQKPAVTLLTNYIPIDIRGSMGALNALTADDIKVTVTFDSSVLGTGTHTLPVEIEVTKAGTFEIVNTTETVTLQIEIEDTGTESGGEEEGDPTET